MRKDPRTSSDSVKLFAPGRLCLFGEHADWAAQFGRHRGYCLVIGTDQGIVADAQRDEEFVVETFAGDPACPPRRVSLPWRKDALRQAAGDREGFFRYCAGVACEMIDHPGVRGGLKIEISRMDLPLQKGVASSAAVCILVARAFDAAYGLGLFPHELMELAYRGERLTGSQCGRMDQACIYGKTPVLLTFEGPDGCRVEPVFPRKEIHMFFVDLAGRKDTVRILSDLQSAYPASEQLQWALGEANERVVRRAHQALESGDAERLGLLMIEAQALFDRCVAPRSAGQLESPLLHEVLAMKSLVGHVFGGKGVGSQGDGTAQFVARSRGDRNAAMAIVEQVHPEMKALPLTIAALAE